MGGMKGLLKGASETGANTQIEDLSFQLRGQKSKAAIYGEYDILNNLGSVSSILELSLSSAP